MTRPVPLVVAAILAVTAFSTVPAVAQDRHARQPSSHARTTGERAVPNRAVPSAVAPRAVAPAVVAPRAVAPVVVAPRAVPRAVAPVVRPQVVRPYYGGAYYARPYYARPYYVRPYYAAPYYAAPYYAPPYYAPPYVFRPHLTLGFGVVLGYPVPYAYASPYPVPVYGYAAPSAPVIVGPSSTQYGSVSLEITPSDASVYVDGGYAGLVRDFDGRKSTLTLNAGQHRVEIDAPGYAPMTLDVNAIPGQIVPYRGSLQPLSH